MDFFLNFLFFQFSEIKNISTFEFILNSNNARVILKDSYLEYFEISRLLTILEKNLFRTSAVSNSVLTNSPFSDKFILSLVMILSENDGFIVFQKSLLSRISFSFKFAKYFFLDFFKSETQ